MADLRTLGAVKALVYDTVFKRAQEIAASEKLRAVVFEGKSMLKGTAESLGSSPSDVYTLSVSIDGAAAVGNCSCPAGKNAKFGLCKHVVALLLRRVQQAQIVPKATPSRSASVDALTISIADENDEIEARKPTDGRDIPESSISRGAATPVSSSKRALPAWMLGSTGSVAAAPATSRKRAVPPKPPRPPPRPPPRSPLPPIKRSRRSAQPLKISNTDFDEGDEDPGEVEDAGPIQEVSGPAVVEEDEIVEPIILPTEGAAARERRRLRALKNEEDDVLTPRTGNAEAEKAGGRPRRSVTKAVENEPVRSNKRKRLVKKYVEDDIDFSDEQIAPVDNDFCLTDDDLVFLAQEQVESDKTAGQSEDLRLRAEAEPVQVTKLPEKTAQGKKSSSIFSMNNWKGLSSASAATTGGALRLTADDLDLETLKNYSLISTSPRLDEDGKPPLDLEGVLPSLQTDILPSLPTSEAATRLRDATPLATAIGSDETDAVANDMLHLFFGSTISGNVAAASSPTASSLQDSQIHSAAAVGLNAPSTIPIVERLDGGSINPAAGANLDNLDVQSKPKKKGSLKDRVKMLMS